MSLIFPLACRFPGGREAPRYVFVPYGPESDAERVSGSHRILLGITGRLYSFLSPCAGARGRGQLGR